MVDGALKATLLAIALGLAQYAKLGRGHGELGLVDGREAPSVLSQDYEAVFREARQEPVRRRGITAREPRESAWPLSSVVPQRGAELGEDPAEPVSSREVEEEVAVVAQPERVRAML